MGSATRVNRLTGACIYIRTIDKDNNVKTQLLTAKTRAAPAKTVTLPRLELRAAHVLVKSFRSTIRALRRMSFERIFLWSDSAVTLHWIKTSPHKLKTFVSRGLGTKELISNALWFHGPSWLNYKEDKWLVFRLEPMTIPEIRPSALLTTPFSTFSKLKRVDIRTLQDRING